MGIAREKLYEGPSSRSPSPVCAEVSAIPRVGAQSTWAPSIWTARLASGEGKASGDGGGDRPRDAPPDRI
jgi:hypothetical protein